MVDTLYFTTDVALIMKDEIYKDPQNNLDKFTFSTEVTNVFNDMITRSVPGYQENLALSADIIYRYYIDGGLVVDLGSSTGALAQALLERFKDRPFRYLGIDSSEPMVQKARQRVAGKEGKNQLQFITGDIRDKLPEKFDIAISAYTLQFINPQERLKLLQQIYSSLPPKGAFLFCEKVIEKDQSLTSLFQEMHHEFKRKNGYSELEISQKRDAIEDILVPLSDEKNKEMVKKAGFQTVSLYLKMINFASYLAVKQ